MIIYDGPGTIFFGHVAGIEHDLAGWLGRRKAEVHGRYVFFFYLYDVHLVELLDEGLCECRLAGLGTKAVNVLLYLGNIALLVLDVYKRQN